MFAASDAMSRSVRASPRICARAPDDNSLRCPARASSSGSSLGILVYFAWLTNLGQVVQPPLADLPDPISNISSHSFDIFWLQLATMHNDISGFLQGRNDLFCPVDIPN